MFGGLFGKRLSTAWEYSVDGVLWRLLPGADGLLVGEDRDLEKKSVSFFCLDAATGAVRWKNVQFPEQWWISMELIHNNVLILHEYAAPDMPDHKKLYGVDLATGAVLWLNEEAKLLFAHGDHLYTARDTFEERIFTEIRLLDGTVVRTVGAEEIREVQRSLPDAPAGAVEFPSVALPGELRDPLVGPALAVLTKDGAERALTEYIATDGYVVAAVCTASAPLEQDRTFQQRITVFDRTRNRIVFADEMNARLSMPVPDMFFRKGPFAYYIKEKSTLCAVHLK